MVFSAYLGATLLMTYPVALSLTRSIPMDPQIKDWYPGDGDPWHFLWAVWYFARAIVEFPPRLFWTDLVFYPLGFDMPFLTGIGAVLLPAALLQRMLGPTLEYNVLWILSFVFTGYATYRLGRFLFGDRPVAFFCGLAFMFSAYRMAHALEHLPLLWASPLIPLFALGLFRAVEEPTTKRWVQCAIVWAVSAGIWWYATISMLVYLGVFALVGIHDRWRDLRLWPHVGSLAVAVAVLVAVASPFAMPLVLSPARDSIVQRPLSESNLYAADLLAFLVPSPRNPVFGPLVGPLYERFTGNFYEQTVYLGFIVLVLALVGVAHAPREKRRLFVVTAATFCVLALGPFLHVHGRDQFSIGGRGMSVPLPYLLLHYIPVLEGMRVPSRFAELMMFALVMLAGYGLSALCRRLAGRRWRAALLAVLMGTVAVESAAAPFPVLSTAAPRAYVEIGSAREPFTVLELPLDWRIIKYHYYQTIHEKRLVVGHPVRSRSKYTSYPEGLPLIPILRDPRLLLDRPWPAEARRDAARLAAFFDIRYVVIHRAYLDPGVFERLDRFVDQQFPHGSRRVDGDVVVYAVTRADTPGALWPEDYAIDFGAPDREFALLSGWSKDERWGDTTFQWSSAPESSMYLYLGEPTDRLLGMRLLPLAYRGAPRQSLSVYVNGTFHDRLTLEPGWARYELKIPARLFRPGLNGLTFKYGYAVSPARVMPGGEDTRTLAVAFDTVTLSRLR